MHGFKLFKLTNPNLTNAKFILADSGYQGIQHLYKQAFAPLKQTKKCPLTQEAKDYNALLSKTQVRVEHIFARLKPLKCSLPPIVNHWHDLNLG